MGEKTTGDTRQETSDEERQQLVIGQINPHHLGGQVIIPDSDERPSYFGSSQVLSEEYTQNRDTDNQVELTLAAAEDIIADGGKGYNHTEVPTGPAPLTNYPHDDELGGGSGNGQVKTLNPKMIPTAPAITPAEMKARGKGNSKRVVRIAEV